MEKDPLLNEIEIELTRDGVDLAQLEQDAEQPDFPYVILMMAMIKDSLDGVSLGLLSLITTPVFGLTFFFWMMGRGAFMRKFLWKKILKKFALSAAAKSIPLIQMLPVTTLLVVIVHNQEKKIVQILEVLLRQLVLEQDFQLKSFEKSINSINQIAYGNT